MTALTDIILHTAASSCIECGKCSAACSMPSMYEDFSLDQTPRGMVQFVLRQASPKDNKANALPAHIWRCAQCGNCSRACPEQVDCAKLIALLRQTACKEGQKTDTRCCSWCGREIMAAPVQQWLRETIAMPSREEAALPSFLEPYAAEPGKTSLSSAETAHSPEYETLCPVCRRQRYAANNTAHAGQLEKGGAL